MAVERVPGVLSDVVDGTAVLIGPAGTHVVELNAMGSLIWAALDGRREVADLVKAVMTALADPAEVTVQQCEGDVTAFVQELTRLALLRQVPA